MPDPTDAERWLTGVVGRAALLATEIAQLTDYLELHRTAEPASVIDAHARILEEQLRRLDSAANE
ncbi:hypothetical protein [Actinophytocola oryzae]|uniref:Uncharacterized protein n=1 Tax=Actinophytocola oryzae TaxID=502181 RepID=A0A4R7VCZ5_9PSEU|nr:hypothetical protein [Actinophytocola oryzae]TDV46848.1 hypothetical protein CLV71_11028 [Actinophytocola oryzae]